ncbi:N-acetylmuramoyl-L-alanine amidase [Rhodococcus spelaei]|uniref:N-acetylmuramoyl-L-alanine amidase n=1 Tax=Rhodococcus spelaei TaxID=2546320 RepID=A0A541BLR4_9NOCA|nr:N-acetylmuramoyl-L-alanine amidase [Rhodococcus spelaei]TQF73263.1 N-acetylmuramoyl-L-alanine amidase [Rhodococcus spelaei]
MKKTLVTAGLVAASLTAMLVPGVAAADPTTAPATPAAEGAANPTPLTGKTVFLDPGHQGTNHSENLSRQVDDGRGGKKDCQTTGMTSLGGVPEHTINWNVSQLVKTSLETLGAKVVLSRADDSGWGGCVDERAQAANKSGADLAMSIHADSTTTGADDKDHGFHLIVPTLPVPDAKVQAVQSTTGLEASKLMRDAYVKNGFTAANYAGVVDGIQSRSDIAGPALTTVPLVFVEMGNGSNPDDAAVLDSQQGQLKHAIAIVTGAVNYLMGVTSNTATTPAATTTPATAAPSTTAPAAATETTTTTTTPAPATTTTTATPEAAQANIITQGLATLQTLLQTFGLDGLKDFATAENLGVFAELISKLLGVISAPQG